MRITGGTARGRRLRAPRGRGTRPTSNKVREAAFDILAARFDLEGIRVLDLFAGTGAFGFEALSRGGADATFVERTGGACRAIAGQAAELGWADRVDVRKGVLPGALAALAGRGPWDGVFLDPPYDSDALTPVLERLGGGAFLHEGAWVMVEHDDKRDLHDEIGSLTRTAVRAYGTTRLSLFEVDG